MNKTIPLTKGKVALVSDEDHEYLLSVGRWSYSNSGYAVFYGRHADGGRTTVSMHRLIVARMLGHPIPEGLTVDHISGSIIGKPARLDNRRENLRLATYSQQQANKKPVPDTQTGLRGVTVEGHRYRARIKFDRGKRLNLGRHADAIFAAHLYDAASILLNREFAGRNYPDEPMLPEIEAIVWQYIERNAYALAFLCRAGAMPPIDT